MVGSQNTIQWFTLINPLGLRNPPYFIDQMEIINKSFMTEISQITMKSPERLTELLFAIHKSLDNQSTQAGDKLCPTLK